MMHTVCLALSKGTPLAAGDLGRLLKTIAVIWILATGNELTITLLSGEHLALHPLGTRGKRQGVHSVFPLAVSNMQSGG